MALAVAASSSGVSGWGRHACVATAATLLSSSSIFGRHISLSAWLVTMTSAEPSFSKALTAVQPLHSSRRDSMRAAGAQSQPGSASVAAATSSATPAAGGGCAHAGEGGGVCATCAELKARYAEHDEWLDSLQRAAEGVVAANQQAQAIAERQLGPDAVAQTPKPPDESPKE